MGQKNNGAKGDEKKKEDEPITLVLKVDMHCDGCYQKVAKCVKRFTGVKDVRGDCSACKLTVTGNVDPEEIRERLERKTKKNVELISPKPKNEKNGGNEKKKEQNKDEEKKPKEPPVTSVVLKVRLHCDGCISKIQKIIRKIRGVQDVSVDASNDKVTVTGTMDAKELPEYLMHKLKRVVEIVPPKKDEKKEKNGGDDAAIGSEKNKKGNKEKKGDKPEKTEQKTEQTDQKTDQAKQKSSPEKAENGKPHGKEEPEPAKVETNKMEYFPQQDLYGYGYAGEPVPGYPVQYVYAPQLFSDENPNACSVM